MYLSSGPILFSFKACLCVQLTCIFMFIVMEVDLYLELVLVNVFFPFVWVAVGR